MKALCELYPPQMRELLSLLLVLLLLLSQETLAGRDDALTQRNNE